MCKVSFCSIEQSYLAISATELAYAFANGSHLRSTILVASPMIPAAIVISATSVHETTLR